MHSSLPSGFPCGSGGKESACSEGDLGSIPGLGRSPEEGKGYALQRSDLESSVDCIVHGVTKSQARVSDFHCHQVRSPYYTAITTIHVLNFFHLSKLPLHTHFNNSLFPFHSPWHPRFCFISISLQLRLLSTAHKWNHMRFILLSLF